MTVHWIVARGAIFVGTGVLALGIFAHGPDMTPGEQGLVHHAEAKGPAPSSRLVVCLREPVAR